MPGQSILGPDPNKDLREGVADPIANQVIHDHEVARDAPHLTKGDHTSGRRQVVEEKRRHDAVEGPVGVWKSKGIDSVSLDLWVIEQVCHGEHARATIGRRYSNSLALSPGLAHKRLRYAGGAGADVQQDHRDSRVRTCGSGERPDREPGTAQSRVDALDITEVLPKLAVCPIVPVQKLPALASGKTEITKAKKEPRARRECDAAGLGASCRWDG